MTLQELKKEAKKQGYKLVKDNPLPKLLPCKCGRKRMSKEYWSCGKTEKVIIVCPSCNIYSEGSTERKARENWNKLMSR